MPLRVLHLSAGNLYGGIERMLTTLAHERDCCPEMKPSFGLCFEGRAAAELRSEGVPVHMLGEVRFSRPWTVWRARRQLRSLIAQEHFDVIVCHACWPHALFATTVRATDTPLVFWSHDVLTGKNWLERLASRTLPNLVLANSQYTLRSVPVVFPQSVSSVFYCPVSIYPEPATMARADVRRELAVRFSDVVIIMFARLEEWKGHLVLLHALRELRDLSGWTCWIAGGPQRTSEVKYFRKLQLTAENAGIEGRVRFLGQRNDMSRLLAGSDVHCQPNTGPEPFGLAFIESLAAGLPVVTSNLGAAPEIVTTNSGVLVPPNDIAALCDALRPFIRGDREFEGARCRERASELCSPSHRLPGLLSQLRHAVNLCGVAA